MGTAVRHPSLGIREGATEGSTVAVPRTAGVIEPTNGPLDWLESRFDDAQQVSACAWVRTPPASESDAPLLCMGHAPLSEQHAMRDSGVGIQPAHTAALLASNVRLRASAEKRWMTATTLSSMLKRA